MVQKIAWSPASRINVDANGRTFKDLVIDSTRYLVTEEINGATFDSCSFLKTSIADSTIKNTDFVDCQFTNATIRDAVCIATDFQDTSFENVSIDAVFMRCSFYDVDFTHCDFRQDCRFINCIFDACSFPGTIVETPMETFSSSEFCECRDIPPIPMACPETGAFIGYKKGVAVDCKGGFTSVIITLLIPEEAARSSATGRKCRCRFAKVMSIEEIGSAHNVSFDEARSMFDRDFIYRTGETVRPDNWDENRWDMCSHGIHFFMSRQEAIDY